MRIAEFMICTIMFLVAINSEERRLRIRFRIPHPAFRIPQSL